MGSSYTESIVNTLKNKHEKLVALQIVIDAMLSDIGPILYPNVVGRRVKLSISFSNLPWALDYECVGYTLDPDGEIIMKCLDGKGEPIVYKRHQLNKFEIVE